METYAHLKSHDLELPLFGKQDFSKFKIVDISDLHANQKNIDLACLERKLKGKGLSVPYIVEYKEKLILIDGHHTVIAKKLNGQKRIKALFLQLNVNH